MNCRSEIVTRDPWLVTRYSFFTSDERRATRHGFTLVEGMAAVALLAFIGATAWVAIDRCMMSAADSTQRMRAFEVARENMEKLLSSTSVTETTEFGVSEKFPDILWQTTIETIYEPVNSRMWVQAVCSAEYSDSAGENKTVELTHWLTELTKEQADEVKRRNDIKNEFLAAQTIETEDLAAQYAGVSVETIRRWVQNGMPLTQDGQYLRPWLNLYYRTGGSPAEDDIQNVIAEYPELPAVKPKMPAPGRGTERVLEPVPDIDLEGIDLNQFDGL